MDHVLDRGVIGEMVAVVPAAGMRHRPAQEPDNQGHDRHENSGNHGRPLPGWSISAKVSVASFRIVKVVSPDSAIAPRIDVQ